MHSGDHTHTQKKKIVTHILNASAQYVLNMHILWKISLIKLKVL